MLLITYYSVSIALFLFATIKKWKAIVAMSYLFFLVVFAASAPIPGKDRTATSSPNQIVFRFDEFRYLVLSGSQCEGGLYYIDEQKQIYTILAVHSARALTEPFAHEAGDYIFIPYSDYSGAKYSQDGGRTFKIIHVDGDDRPRREQVKGSVVVNNQMFIDSTKGIYRSPEPFGTDTGTDLLSPANQSRHYGSLIYSGDRWNSPPPASLPALPNDYKGWYNWRCDYDLRQAVVIHSRFSELQQLQGQLRALIGLTQKVSSDEAIN